MNILLLSGSSRNGSFNTALLDSAASLLKDCQTSRFAIEQLPFYSDSLDGDNRPAVVRDFITAVEQADALLIATPEYNYSIPAVLKNALDWASRPAFVSPMKGKPVAIVSASPAISGGIQAQAHLKHVLAGMLANSYPSPAFCVGQSHNVINNGKLQDGETEQRLAGYLEGFLHWLETGRL